MAIELTADEKAYMESGGAAPIAAAEVPDVVPAEATPADTAVAPDAVVVDDTTPDALDDVTPDQKADATDKVDGAVKPPLKTVPQQALFEEREERRKAEQKARQLEASEAAAKDTLNQILEKLRLAKAEEDGVTTPEVVDDPRPDPNTNIFEFAAWQERQLQKQAAEVEAIRKGIAERDEQARTYQQATQFEQAVAQKWDADIRSFSTTTPVFSEAAAFLSEKRNAALAKLAKINPALATQEGRNAAIDAELKNVIVMAGQNNANAAEIIYDLAVEAGYAPKADPTPPTPATPAIPKPSLAIVEKGQAAAKSVSQGAGVPAQGELTRETINAMSPAKLAEWMKKPANERFFNKLLMGG